MFPMCRITSAPCLTTCELVYIGLRFAECPSFSFTSIPLLILFTALHMYPAPSPFVNMFDVDDNVA
jgi:hypothetical protein